MSARYQILQGLPPYGPPAVPIAANGWNGAWGGHREGLVIRFNPETSDAWVANFQPGSGGWEGILDHPSKKYLIVVARGQGYMLDPAARGSAQTLSDGIQHVLELPDLEAVVFSDGLRFEAIRGGGIWWRSPRISWDETRNIVVDGTILRGEASTPVGGDNAWVPFTLDLMTGQCEDGVYESDMRRAIPIKRPAC